MAILLDEKTEVVVQGATGKEGQFRIQLEIIQPARECQAIVVGPNSIGMVSPGKAIISRGMGTAEGKIAALREAGVHVVEHLGDIGPAARRFLIAFDRAFCSSPEKVQRAMAQNDREL